MRILFVVALFFSVLLMNPAYAHPGNTASDGCHYCRTNCDKWGVPWNTRHCHNTYSAPVYTPPVTPKQESEDNSLLTSVLTIAGLGGLAYLLSRKKKVQN